ncbi:hypothetical protein M9434_003617 [Picochlorum sp. BPE23]|nr:hypothetical protein M9434_003617 [Picochlorum sp. BPE23]
MENHIVNVPSKNDAGSIKSEDQDGHLENQLATPHQQFPAVKDHFVSPPRSALKQLTPTDQSHQLLSPATISKNELNDAALALTWLSEACVGSEMDRREEAIVQRVMERRSDESQEKTGKRAASRKCAAMIKNALSEEKRSSKIEKVPKVTVQKVTKAKKGKQNGEAPRKRSRNYSQNSRVGRAVQAIYAYITKHQVEYLSKGAKGVPERSIRLEFGNNPDTSKALRFLVTGDRINRLGLGGRKDPFSYTIKMQSSNETDSAGKNDSALLNSLKTPPTEIGNSGPAAAAAILTAPSTRKQLLQEVVSTARTEKQKPVKPCQPRLSFGETQDPISGFGTEKVAGNLPPGTLSPLPNLSMGNCFRSTIIKEDKNPEPVQQNEKVGSSNLNNSFQPKPWKMQQPGQHLVPSAAQTAYMMHMYAAQLYCRQMMMSNLCLNDTTQSQNNNTTAGLSMPLADHHDRNGAECKSAL